MNVAACGCVTVCVCVVVMNSYQHWQVLDCRNAQVNTFLHWCKSKKLTGRPGLRNVQHRATKACARRLFTNASAWAIPSFTKRIREQAE